VAFFLLWAVLATDPVVVTRCAVVDDAENRVYELLRSGEEERIRWMVGMRSRQTGASRVLLPLPDAKPVLKDAEVALDYRTSNGGREVHWKVTPSAATISVYANFELEVNVEADLDPRVELMNTEGPITRLSCGAAL
jgi:hypothetical protein